MLGNRVTFLIGPEAHEPFLKKGDDELDQNEPYRFAIPLFGPGVVYDVSVEKRNQQLKMIKGRYDRHEMQRASLRHWWLTTCMSRSLSTVKLQSYVPLIVQETEQFFAKVCAPSLATTTTKRGEREREREREIEREMCATHHSLMCMHV